MYQVFFFSVLLNLVAGYILIAKEPKEVLGFTLDIDQWKKGSKSLIMAILLFTTAVFQLLSVTRGNIPLVGDVIPVLLLALAGLIFLLRYSGNRGSEAEIKQEPSIFKYAGYIGYANIIAGVLHFFFHPVLFL